MKIEVTHSYIMTPHVLQEILNNKGEQFTVDFGPIKAEVKIVGNKSTKSVEIKEVRNGAQSNSRSNEGANEEVRKEEQPKPVRTVNRQRTKVAS